MIQARIAAWVAILAWGWVIWSVWDSLEFYMGWLREFPGEALEELPGYFIDVIIPEAKISGMLAVVATLVWMAFLQQKSTRLKVTDAEVIRRAQLGEHMAQERQQRLCQYLHEHPGVSMGKMADELSFSLAQTRAALRELRKAGRVKKSDSRWIVS